MLACNASTYIAKVVTVNPEFPSMSISHIHLEKQMEWILIEYYLEVILVFQ